MTPGTSQLLIQAVCAEPSRARGAWQQWRRSVDFEAEEQPADRLLLLPALARRPDVIHDDPAAGRIRGMYRRTWVANQLLWQEAAGALSVLDGGGIPAAFVDGAAVIDLLGDLGERPLDAVDILVPPASLGSAVDRLLDAGWSGTSGPRLGADPRTLRHLRHLTLTRDDGRLRLHWRLLATAAAPLADGSTWAAATPRTPDGPGHRLHPADVLLRLLADDPSGDAGARLVDAHRVAAGPSLPPLAPRLAAEARAHHVLDTCERALTTLAGLTGTTECEPLLGAMRATRRSALERLTRRGGTSTRTGRAVAALAAHAAGQSGIRRGVTSLVVERLDLDFAVDPRRTVVHAALGRSPAAARLLRRGGALSRVRAADAAALHPGATLDFRDPVTLSRYAGHGWRAASDLGTATAGNEARLLLPIAAVTATPLRLVLDFAADQRAPVLVTVDDRPLGATPGRGGPARLELPLPPTAAGRTVEIALRSSERRGLWPRPLFVILRSMQLVPPL